MFRHVVMEGRRIGATSLQPGFKCCQRSAKFPGCRMSLWYIVLKLPLHALGELFRYTP